MIYKVGIIGMGKMGRIRKREFDLHFGFEVVAICDVNTEVGTEFPHLFFSNSWEDIIDKTIDVVVVCTYNNIVPTIICRALENQLHVFSEKPPGNCVGDVEKIIKSEKKSPESILKFGFNHRFHYSVMEAKALIESGRYGNVLWARGIYGKAGSLDYMDNWRANPSLAGGGILLDQGIHMIDLLRYFLGEFTEVKSFVERSYWKESEVEDNAFALLKTAKNQVAMLHSSATQWKHKFSLDIYLEKGYVNLEGILSSSRSYGEESITFAKKQFEDEARAFGRPREEKIFFDTDNSWKLEIEEFHSCLTGEIESPSGNTSDAMSVMKLISRIYSAAKNPMPSEI
jgi:predicted dehydrogenase